MADLTPEARRKAADALLAYITGRWVVCDHAQILDPAGAVDAVVNALAAESCICVTSGPQMDGPDRDCPTHGETIDDVRDREQRALAKAEEFRAERARAIDALGSIGRAAVLTSGDLEDGINAELLAAHSTNERLRAELGKRHESRLGEQVNRLSNAVGDLERERDDARAELAEVTEVLTVTGEKLAAVRGQRDRAEAERDEARAELARWDGHDALTATLVKQAEAERDRAEAVCILLGWTPVHDQTTREKALGQLWSEWAATKPHGFMNPANHPPLSDEEIERLARTLAALRAEQDGTGAGQ